MEGIRAMGSVRSDNEFAPPDPPELNEVLSTLRTMSIGQGRIEKVLLDIQSNLGTRQVPLTRGCVATGCDEGDIPGPQEAEGQVRFSHLSGSMEVPIQSFASESCHSMSDEVPPSLPLNWPASVQMRSSWMSGGSLRSKTCRPDALMVRPIRSEPKDVESVVIEEGCARKFMVNPHGIPFTMYSLLSLFMLGHDVLLVPFIIAWDMKLENTFLVTSMVSCCFWTIDICVSFITGYNRAGKLEMRLASAVQRYAKSWFLPDAIVTSCDWLGLISALMSQRDDSLLTIRLLRFTKVLKLLRLFGLVRMMRVLKVVESLMDNSLSDNLRVVQQFVMFVCSMFVMNHLVGCGYFFLGRLAPSDTGVRWMDVTSFDWGGNSVMFLATKVQYQYLCAVHWSMAQVVGGSVDIPATNSIERIFTMFSMAGGLLFGCTIVSTLSARMVEYNMTRNDQNQRIRKLRRFLRENKIRRGIATLVQEQVKERLAVQAKLREEDVFALKLLSNGLRTTLRYEIAKDSLCTHPLFRLWNELDPAMVRDLCAKALETIILAPHDDLFVPGTIGNKIYYMISGQMVYIQEPATAPVHGVVTTRVEAGNWLCEAALWSQWIHVGLAKCRSQCEVLALRADFTEAAVQKHPLVADITCEYCRVFHRRLVVAKPPDTSWPTDLEVPLTEYSDVVVSMSHELQEKIGLLALGHSPNQRRLSRRSTLGDVGKFKVRGSISSGAKDQDLVDEVLDGRSTVMLNSAGEVERVVSLVELRCESDEYGVLVEVCRLDDDGSSRLTKCELPNCKVEAGEMLQATLTRLLARFDLRADEIHFSSVHREVEWTQSRGYGIRTKYIRIVHTVALPDPPVFPTLAISARDELFSADFRTGPVYKISSRLCTWIEPVEYEFLRSPAGEEKLSQWVNQVLGTPTTPEASEVASYPGRRGRRNSLDILSNRRSSEESQSIADVHIADVQEW